MNKQHRVVAQYLKNRSPIYRENIRYINDKYYHCISTPYDTLIVCNGVSLYFNRCAENITVNTLLASYGCDTVKEAVKLFKKKVG